MQYVVRSRKPHVAKCVIDCRHDRSKPRRAVIGQTLGVLTTKRYGLAQEV